MTAELIARCRAGDAEAFRELVEPFRRELMVHCYFVMAVLCAAITNGWCDYEFGYARCDPACRGMAAATA